MVLRGLKTISVDQDISVLELDIVDIEFYLELLNINNAKFYVYY